MRQTFRTAEGDIKEKKKSTSENGDAIYRIDELKKRDADTCVQVRVNHNTVVFAKKAVVCDEKSKTSFIQGWNKAHNEKIYTR